MLASSRLMVPPLTCKTASKSPVSGFAMRSTPYDGNERPYHMPQTGAPMIDPIRHSSHVIPLTLVDDAAVTASVAAERDRLLREAGIARETAHFRRPQERPFTREERERVTILFGGLTTRHEELVLAAF